MNNENWLFFSFSLPAKNQSGRMRIWRRLTGLGAVILKNAFYALPAREDLREQFTWLAKEVEGLGGEALFLETGPPANMTGEEVAALLTQARDADWRALEAEVLPLLDQARAPGADTHALDASCRRLAKRADALRVIDYFPGGHGDRVEALLAEATVLLSGQAPGNAPAVPGRDPAAYKGLTWITREHPYVDRLASFWLVRRFVDPEARIAFVPAATKAGAREGSVRFDMAEAEFTHIGGLTTFEVLCESFGLSGRVPARLRGIIRAIDLGGLETGPPEVVGVKLVLDGLTRSARDDMALVEQGLALFDALLASCSPAGDGEEQ
ncbi:chromate resistance protein ChrB domain-containing protein [Fundidesulfovibrio terrae]|uniref:chromate resistance protein ChrB domain-containing protein n=1 Tax=Fundidesulfovibrio terrae TaxID=2922866 RepID=UPI001FAED205|nr:chromate resistance protein ChrB domain-containing protein [Fundidesulfovibrio terrae]